VSHAIPVTTVASEASAPRRLAAALWRRPTLGRWLLLALPLAWLGLVYLGSLAVLFLNAFWRLDPFTGQVVRELTFDNFITLATTEVFRTITLRTLGIAAAVTVACALIAFPIAYYMARVASRRARAVMLVAILMPLWSSYLVKVYAWRTILAGNGLLDWLLAPFGLASPGFGEFAIWLVFTYLWLPYMILPIFTALERLPPSLLEASADLGARAGFTFRRVILPITIPAVAAGSIFTFSLTIGDYITPRLVSNTKFIGNVVYENVGVAGNIPLAAAFALVPVVVMIAYLFVARRIGAFDSL
jgi:putative spermidine/putrescine transport system permease protein